MIKSLKSKFVLVITLLVMTLLGQVILSNLIQNRLIQNEQALITSYTNIGIVHEIERNLVDLQRVLLVYKETSSENSSALFSEIMKESQRKLLLFSERILNNSTVQIDTHLIDRMENHLEDFADNFNSLLETREMQENLYSENILPNFEFILSKMSNLKSEQERSEIKYLISLAEKTLEQYLISPDYEFMNKLKSTLSLAEQFAKKNTLFHTQTQNNFIQINKAVSRLTTITRGYIFLVNVVMAGSANEFLILTKTLREDLIKQQQKLNELTKLSAVESQLTTNTASVIAILIIFLISYFLTQQILKPINKLTTIFGKLSKDEKLAEIPETHRNDEIGALAKAAEVFQRKNLQTSQLLLEAQEMNMRQEELNSQLEVEKKRAESAAESKAMFLANMSHEIRTPMNGIIGLVELLKSTSLSEQQQDYVHKVAFSGNIMMNVINDILDFSKIEAGKLNIELIEFDVNELIENLITTLSPKIDKQRINFRVSYSENLPVSLYGDPLRISQIILNLCNNSIKFTEHGSIELNLGYDSSSDRSELIIKVTDTGIGMSEDQLNGIFESFTQADGSTSRKYGGTGLGLSIVKQLSRLMGGDVCVFSQKDMGTTFKVNLLTKPCSKLTIVATTQFEPFDNIKYFRAETKLLSDDIVKVITDNVSYDNINNIQLNTELYRHDSNMIVIEIENHDMFASVAKHFAFIKKQNLNVVFICNSTLCDFSDQLEKTFPGSSLVHPFSPAEFSTFLEQINSPKAKAIPIRPDANENTDETKLSGHILIVEDNQINQLVAGHMIQNYNLSYDIANDGAEAVEKVLSGTQYSLVLMDVQMPIMDGYKATQEIRAKGFNELIICGLSANAMKADYDTAKQAGMNDYLTKPIEAEALKKVLLKYLKD